MIKLAGDFLNIVMQAAAADFANTEGVYVHVKVVLFILLPEKNGTVSVQFLKCSVWCQENAVNMLVCEELSLLWMFQACVGLLMVTLTMT